MKKNIRFEKRKKAGRNEIFFFFTKILIPRIFYVIQEFMKN